MIRKWTIGAGILVLAGAFSLTQVTFTTTGDAAFVVDGAAPRAARGAAAFAAESFGGLSVSALESHAIPWKLITAALALREIREQGSNGMTMEAANRALARFGFLPGATPVNLPEGVTASAEGATPLGITQGTLAPLPGAKVTVANLGCAACHAGVTYDANGLPDPTRAWLGTPNTSLNLEAYVSGLTAAMRSAAEDPSAWIDATQTLFPTMGWRERQTLRWLIIPLVRQRLKAIGNGPPLPFPNGHPGATNGVAALKHAYNLPFLGGGKADAGVVSIPELGDRTWRSALLSDGSYAPPGADRWKPVRKEERLLEQRDDLAAITSFFSVPSMGVDPENAVAYVSAAEDIFAWLDETYRPQPFPATIDTDRAARGARVYAENCAICHGTYRTGSSGPELMEFPNWAGDVGTDPLRAEAFTPALAEAVNSGVYGDRISAKATGIYAAPPLTGLWSSAPYLHNGSVPSVWALLNPAERPKRFAVGGHALDLTLLGIARDGILGDHLPFSEPFLIDTREPGMGNGGHVFGATLNQSDKGALLEFLKQL